MSYRSTTSVVILKDFKIISLPIIPSAYVNRIDPAVWQEFVSQVQNRTNQTFAQTNDIAGAASKRRCLQITYIVCAPLVFILGYLAYYCLLITGLYVYLLAIGAILAIAAFASFIGAVVTATKCGSMMKAYRFACQQDLNGAFAYMNQRYNNMIYFSTARSTHRNNGKVQLGITVVLRAQNITPNMAQMVGTATGQVNVMQQGVMPVQVQGVPMQLPNGQIVYQVAAQPQQGQQVVMPIQQQMQQQMAQQPVQMQQVVVPIQQQQGGPPQYGAPQYQPPNVNANAPPMAYGAMEGGEGVNNGNNNNNANANGGTTGGPDQYQ